MNSKKAVFDPKKAIPRAAGRRTAGHTPCMHEPRFPREREAIAKREISRRLLYCSSSPSFSNIMSFILTIMRPAFPGHVLDEIGG